MSPPGDTTNFSKFQAMSPAFSRAVAAFATERTIGAENDPRRADAVAARQEEGRSNAVVLPP
jgi:hypothetical protein